MKDTYVVDRGLALNADYYDIEEQLKDAIKVGRTYQTTYSLLKQTK